MASVAFLVRPGRAQAHRIALATAAWLAEQGGRSRVMVLSAPERVLEDDVERPLEEMDLSKVDLAVSLGGDGTFLRLVSIACAHGVPVLGVNFGRLGYLLDAPPDQVVEAVRRALAGEATIEDRVLLEVSVHGELLPLDPALPVERRAAPTQAPRRHWRALNEMVLEKTVPGHTVQLITSVDGEPLATYRADGVLVATPTGSTAYNLSAGGPVLAPTLRATVITPVAPHLSSDASVVLGPSHTVAVRVGPGRPAALVVDGLPAGRLGPDATVSCRVADQTARLVTYRRRPLARALGSVLMPLTDR